VARCEKLGIAAYLMKPVKQSELFDAIALALGVAAEDALAQPASAAKETRPAKTTQRLNILLAEDSLVNQKLALGLLARQGHDVTVANNGKEAVAAVTARGFDLVLMDVQMPEMDGLEATRAIRAREKKTGTRVPIMAMTAHAMQGDRERCLAAGMDDYIAKPIRAEKLFDKIGLLAQGTPPRSDPPPNVTAGVVDWSEAMGAVNGDRELLKDVVEAFLEESPRQLSEIRQALDVEDFELLRRAAHTLKGSMRIFGAHVANEHAMRLESMGRDHTLDDATEALAVLERELARLTPILMQFVGRGDQVH